jgi:methionine-rich copper-binding protein CopC
MRFMTRTKLTAAAAAALAGVFVTAAPAQAHTTLTSSDPAKGSTTTSPARIRLTYGDPVRFPGVVVEDAKGGHHESGKPSAVGNHVVQQVAGTLPPGLYTVGWRAVAQDGHPVTGTFTFTVKADAAGSSTPAASAGAASPEASATTQPAAQSSRSTSSAGWWWIGLVILVLALAGGGVALARRRG